MTTVWAAAPLHYRVPPQRPLNASSTAVILSFARLPTRPNRIAFAFGSRELPPLVKQDVSFSSWPTPYR